MSEHRFCLSQQYEQIVQKDVQSLYKDCAWYSLNHHQHITAKTICHKTLLKMCEKFLNINLMTDVGHDNYFKNV